MDGSPGIKFWGKLERDQNDDVVAYHPLHAHCADVAACAELLLRDTLLGQRLGALAGQRLDQVSIARLSVIAALHDLGKFNHGFQRKGMPKPQNTAGHVQEVMDLFANDRPATGAQLLGQLAFLDGWGAGEDDDDWSVGCQLLFAAIGHHGRPTPIGTRANHELWKPQEREPLGGTADLIRRVRDWYPEAFSGAGILPCSRPFVHAFAGLVMLADWLGSDKSAFTYASDEGDRMPFARETARRVCGDIGLYAKRAHVALAADNPSFSQVFGGRIPRKAQETVLALPTSSTGAITVLESETGSGKTEAALGRYLALFREGLVDGLTFALPTRTAATQIHTRIVKAIAAAFGSAAPPVTLAVPGYLKVDEAVGKRLAPFSVLWNDDPKALRRHERWAAENPKRYLAGAIVVGTIDQVLLSSLSVSHAHLRATSLLRHLLVVDEVHASDTYMNRILEEVLKFHIAAGGQVLLMSATLGSDVRSRLLTAAGSKTDKPDLVSAVSVPYPAVHDAPVGVQKAPTCHIVEQTTIAREIDVTVSPNADDFTWLAEVSLKAARTGARVLIIRNTVSAALATQAEVERLAGVTDQGLLFAVAGANTLHHARFSQADRLMLDGAIESRLGENAPQSVGCVIVATQTVQQSLDIDADWILTDLAPADVLLQRFGRLHRHSTRNTARPEPFRRPTACVLTTTKPLESYLGKKGIFGPHGVGTVYDNLLILEATMRELLDKPILNLPADNRRLVERTTHPEALEGLARALGGGWLRHAEDSTGRILAHRTLAALNLVDRTKEFGLCKLDDLDGDSQRQISTRLGEGDRRVVFELPRPAGPFGQPVKELTVPAWLLRGVTLGLTDGPTDIEEVTNTSTLKFSLGSKRFLYDRLGLRPVPEKN